MFGKNDYIRIVKTDKGFSFEVSIGFIFLLIFVLVFGDIESFAAIGRLISSIPVGVFKFLSH
ncbi:MAG: hypothetical protein GY699_08825 [Desulfobacteraceae bacterium]|nr:hypothetical protein [Desulfobacteraceae bacterium]